jgi:1-acyl-sn-glycerol-3-phosphate acyltransferase
MVGASPWYNFVCAFLRTTVYPLYGGCRISGVENIPLAGPVILAPVHFSNLDPPLVVIHQKRKIYVMAKEELLKARVLGRILHSLDVFAVRRGSADTEAIRRAIALLETGHAVLMFPEGTRGDGKSLGPLNAGAAMLAKKTGAKIVPVGINGTQFVLPKGGGKGRRHRMTVVYGKPFTFDEVAGDGSNAEQRERFTAHLAQSIVELCAKAGVNLDSSN